MFTSLLFFLERSTETHLFAFFVSIHHVIHDPIKHCNLATFLCSCQVSLFQTQEGLFCVASLCQEDGSIPLCILDALLWTSFLTIPHPFWSGEGEPEFFTAYKKSANQVLFTIGKWYFQAVLWISPNNSRLVNFLRAITQHFLHNGSYFSFLNLFLIRVPSYSTLTPLFPPWLLFSPALPHQGLCCCLCVHVLSQSQQQLSPHQKTLAWWERLWHGCWPPQPSLPPCPKPHSPAPLLQQLQCPSMVSCHTSEHHHPPAETTPLQKEKRKKKE